MFFFLCTFVVTVCRCYLSCPFTFLTSRSAPSSRALLRSFGSACNINHRYKHTRSYTAHHIQIHIWKHAHTPLFFLVEKCGSGNDPLRSASSLFSFTSFTHLSLSLPPPLPTKNNNNQTKLVCNDKDTVKSNKINNTHIKYIIANSWMKLVSMEVNGQ